jgi:hypothetical protein
MKQPPYIKDRCEFCDRNAPVTKHHLIPRAIHSTKKFMKRFTKKEMYGNAVMVCRLCHSGIHAIIPSEKDLAEYYYTKDLLLAHEGIDRHVQWARKQK